MRRMTLALVLFALGAGGSLAGEGPLYLVIFGQASRYAGDGRIGASAFDGTRFDLVHDFGVDPHQRALGVEGFVGIRRSKILFGYSRWEHSSVGRLEEGIEFSGRYAYPGNWYETEQGTRRARLQYGFDFDAGPVTLGPVVGVQAFRSRLAIRRVQGGCCHIDQEETLSRLVPAAGLSLGLHPHRRLSIHAQASAGALTYHEERTRMWQGSAAVDWILSWKVGVTAGYRLERIAASSNEVGGDNLSATEHGLFAGLTMHL